MLNNNYVNQVVVVTGAANGIGAAIAHAFVEQGATVLFSDVDAKAGKEREKHLLAAAPASQSQFFQADLSDAKEVNEFAKKVLADFTNIKVLVNNAGIFLPRVLLKRPLEEWDNVINLNLRATYLCSQLFLPALISAKGNIINIASTRAIMSEENTEPYSASKGGIVALTHSLAITIGKFHLRANCISPGWIDTSLWHLPAKKPTLREEDHAQHPVGRVGTPEDIAQACLFLASEKQAGFITGHNLIVDGGMTRKMIYAE